MASTKSPKKADQYNDPDHNYLKYWDGRNYEHQAEVLAINRLLQAKRFKIAVDIGGGYGRLDPVLEEYADKVILAEPSQQQLDIAEDYLSGHSSVTKQIMQADDLKFATGSIDLVVMIRVMHHLPDPTVEFAEISRILDPSGYVIIEVANYMHIRNRIKHLIKGRPMPTKPVDIRSDKNRKNGTIAFVNHNPKTVISQLANSGLKVERILSVSNLRSPTLKKIVPRRVMLAIEGILQPVLSKSFFGPSIFLLARKSK